MPTLYTVEMTGKKHAHRDAADAREPQDEPRRTSGFFYGLLFAVPLALLLWALFFFAARALLHVLHHV